MLLVNDLSGENRWENLLNTALLMVMCMFMPTRQLAEELAPQHLLLQDSIAMLLQFFLAELDHGMRRELGLAW